MTERSSILRELMNASILLALVSSLLYISGASYIKSYLTEWGIEASLISSNSQEVLVQGAGIWFVGGLYIVIPAVFLGIGLFLQFYMVSEISKSPLVRKSALKVYEMFKPTERDELDPPYIIQSITKWSLQFVVLFLFLSAFLLMFYWLIEFSSSQAAERANKEYIQFSTGKPLDQRIFSRKKLLTINGVERDGYILANSDSLVVLYLMPSKSSDEKVVIIPLSSITEIEAYKITP